jgi:NitT/TauT family transport system ATP-binding protein
MIALEFPDYDGVSRFACLVPGSVGELEMQLDEVSHERVGAEPGAFVELPTRSRRSDVWTLKLKLDPAMSPAQNETGTAAGTGGLPAIHVSELGYTVKGRDGRPLEILKTIDLKIADGEFVAVIGPSGCGKSTLLNFIAGLIPVQRGQVQVLGTPAHDSDPNVGYMFQHHALMPWRTVLRNAEIGLELRGMAKTARREKVREILRDLGLAGFENHYPSEISGGMRQRASLARTLATDPRILLMDEPFGALDAQTKVLIHEMFLASWEAQRRTVVFVTHDLAESIALADRVIVMSARPGYLMADLRVGIPRPRNLSHLRTDPRFAEYHDKLWEQLRGEAIKAMAGRS